MAAPPCTADEIRIAGDPEARLACEPRSRSRGSGLTRQLRPWSQAVWRPVRRFGWAHQITSTYQKLGVSSRRELLALVT